MYNIKTQVWDYLLVFPMQMFYYFIETSACTHNQILLKLLQNSVQTGMKVQVHALFKLTDGSVLEMHGMPFFWLKTFDYLPLLVKFVCEIYQQLFGPKK